MPESLPFRNSFTFQAAGLAGLFGPPFFVVRQEMQLRGQASQVEG